MRAVRTNYSGTVLLTIVQRHLNLARVFNDVVIRKHMTIAINYESRSLPLLRHQPVEEIERDDLRRDVDD